MTVFISKWIYSHINFRIDCDRILKTTIIFNIKWKISNVEKNMTKGKNYYLNYMDMLGFFAPSCTKTRIHFGYTLYWEISIIIMYAWDSLI